MKRFYCIFLILITSFSVAQNNELRKLLGTDTVDCNRFTERVLKRLPGLSPARDNQKLNNLMNRWANVCGLSEPLMRQNILIQLSKGQLVMDTADLHNVLKDYLWVMQNRQKGSIIPSQAYENHLRYTMQWAEKLLQKNQYPPKEELVLKILSRTSYSKAVNTIYKKEYYTTPLSQNLRKYLREKPKNRGFYEFGVFQSIYTGALGKSFQTTTGLMFSLAYNITDQFSAGFQITANNPNYKSPLRIRSRDTTLTSEGSYNVTFAIRGSYQLFENRISEFRIAGSAGYEILDTGVNELNSEGEEYDVLLGTYNIGLGVEYSLKVFHFHRLGVRFTYHLNDLNLGSKALSNLNGNQIRAGLFYKF